MRYIIYKIYFILDKYAMYEIRCLRTESSSLSSQSSWNHPDRLKPTSLTVKGLSMEVSMIKEDLLGATVRIRRGYHGGKIGKVAVFSYHGSLGNSYTEIKVRLTGSGKVVEVYGDDQLERLAGLEPGGASRDERVGGDPLAVPPLSKRPETRG
jgi:hypothetical protein